MTVIDRIIEKMEFKVGMPTWKDLLILIKEANDEQNEEESFDAGDFLPPVNN